MYLCFIILQLLYIILDLQSQDSLKIGHLPKLEMLGELNTPVGLSIWDKILLIKSKRVHALRDKI